MVSYQQLLQAFRDGHDATYPAYSIQYRSAIFYTTEQQLEAVSAYKQGEAARTGKTVYTDIEPFYGTAFYIAEDYHQKYYLRSVSSLAKELYAIYPDQADFRDSTTAARLNGYVGGYGNQDTLQKNLDNFGLSEKGKQSLLKAAQTGLKEVCPVTIP